MSFRGGSGSPVLQTGLWVQTAGSHPGSSAHELGGHGQSYPCTPQFPQLEKEDAATMAAASMLLSKVMYIKHLKVPGTDQPVTDIAITIISH